MKKSIRLSTLLLLTTIVALCLGLLNQVIQNERELIATRTREQRAAALCSDYQLLNHYLSVGPERFAIIARTKFVTMLRLLWLHEDEYNKSKCLSWGLFKDTRKDPVNTMVARVMDQANVSTHQELIDYALDSTLYGLKGDLDQAALTELGVYPDFGTYLPVPEIRDPNSVEFESFKSFLDHHIERVEFERHMNRVNSVHNLR